jgi:DnaK suppressor protein
MCAKRNGIEAYKTRLVERQQEIWQVSSESADGRQTVELDQTNSGRLTRAGALQSQALAQETDRRRQAELKRIDSALARLDDGEFGFCVVCGDQIGLERLNMDPAVPTCIECASKR